jgi:hypothetical protein
MKRQDIDDIIDTARREHRAPPEAPRERLWERIDAARAPARAENKVVRPSVWSSARWIAATAAVLVLGVALGRWSERFDLGGGGNAPMAVAQGDVVTGTAVYDRMAVTMLDRADALLTDFRTTPCSGPARSTRLSTWAGSLLSETRLLMSTPVADDPDMGRLLSELELVLAQLAGISGSRCDEDSAWIRDGLERRDTLDHLRTVASARRERIAL